MSAIFKCNDYHVDRAPVSYRVYAHPRDEIYYDTIEGVMKSRHIGTQYFVSHDLYGIEPAIKTKIRDEIFGKLIQKVDEKTILSRESIEQASAHFHLRIHNPLLLGFRYKQAHDDVTYFKREKGDPIYPDLFFVDGDPNLGKRFSSDHVISLAAFKQLFEQSNVVSQPIAAS